MSSSLYRPNCWYCTKDRRKCQRSSASPDVCTYCYENSYECRMDGPGKTKRRKLAREKCEQCRRAKQKCNPEDRIWPEKCRLCQIRGLPCSEPQVATKRRRSSFVTTQNTSPPPPTGTRPPAKTVAHVGDCASDFLPLSSSSSAHDGGSSDNSSFTMMENRVPRSPALEMRNDGRFAEEFIRSLRNEDTVPRWVVDEIVRKLDTLTGLCRLSKQISSTPWNVLELQDLPKTVNPAIKSITSSADRLSSCLVSQNRLISARRVLEALHMLTHIQHSESPDSTLVAHVVHKLASVYAYLGEHCLAIATYENFIRIRKRLAYLDKHAYTVPKFIYEALIDLQFNHATAAQSLLSELSPGYRLPATHFFSPLHRALDLNYPDIDHLLRHPLVNINSPDHSGQTPLHRAAQFDNLALAKSLLSLGAPITPLNCASETPLTTAAANGCGDVLQYLIHHPAITSAHLESALLLALRTGERDDIWAIIDKLALRPLRRGPRLLAAAVYNEDYSFIDCLLTSYSVDINEFVPADDGLCALSCAVLTRNTEIVRKLVEIHNAAVNGPRGDGNPLMCAIAQEDTGIVTLLLQSGASSEVLGSNLVAAGQTVLEYAARIGDLEVVEILIDFGGARTEGERGKRALKAAIEEGNVEVVDFLMRRGIGMEQPVEEGDSAVTGLDRLDGLNIVRREVEDWVNIADFVSCDGCGVPVYVAGEREGF